MKYISLLIVCVFYFGSIAQDFSPTAINLFGGKQFANFIFVNSYNTKDQGMKYQMYNAFGFNTDFSNGNHTIRPELQIRQAGARKILGETPVTWKMNYFNFNIGYGYSILNTDRFMIQMGAALSLGYMMSGEQTIGDVRLSIIEEESMNRFELGTYGFANFRAHLTETIDLFLAYRFGIGLNHIENDIIVDQRTRNIYQSALLGISMRI